VQAIGRQPQRAPDGAPVHYERHRPENTTLYRLVQQRVGMTAVGARRSTGSARPGAALHAGVRDAGLEGAWPPP